MNQRFTPDINEQPNMHRYRLDLLKYDESGPSGRALDWCCVVDTVFSIHRVKNHYHMFKTFEDHSCIYSPTKQPFKIYQKVQLL